MGQLPKALRSRRGDEPEAASVGPWQRRYHKSWGICPELEQLTAPGFGLVTCCHHCSVWICFGNASQLGHQLHILPPA